MAEKKQNVNFLSVNKFTNLNVKRDVIAFHNKGNINIDGRFQSSLCFPPLPLDILRDLEGYDTEISPFHHDAITCKTSQSAGIRRERTASTFSGEPISFEVVQSFLNEAYGANEALRRPYPSGGALYSVEPICCLFDKRITGLPKPGIYHYRANLKKLQLLREATNEEMTKHLLSVETSDTHQANFIMFYVINLPKAIVKYRYRGYRLAFMEIGAMFMQADLVAKELGLRNKVSSSFNDFEITRFLQLDATSFMPGVMQLFGKS